MPSYVLRENRGVPVEVVLPYRWQIRMADSEVDFWFGALFDHGQMQTHCLEGLLVHSGDGFTTYEILPVTERARRMWSNLEEEEQAAHVQWLAGKSNPALEARWTGSCRSCPQTPCLYLPLIGSDEEEFVRSLRTLAGVSVQSVRFGKWIGVHGRPDLPKKGKPEFGTPGYDRVRTAAPRWYCVETQCEGSQEALLEFANRLPESVSAPEICSVFSRDGQWRLGSFEDLIQTV